MQHSLSKYKDGWQMISFCTLCGAEGMELYKDCVASIVEASSDQNIIDRYREKMLTHARNFPKSKSLNDLFNSSRNNPRK
jgi:hypothetical protein